MAFDIFKVYSELTADCPINKIGEYINYYQSDDLKSNILVRNCIELDMTSAFPNICRYLFSYSDPEFIDKLFSIEKKIEKNIFLTNYLKDKGSKNNKNYLIELTNYAKILTLSYVYNNYDNINILEFKKDGAVFVGELIYPKNNTLSEFNNYNNFIYHSNNINLYSRFSRTSIYLKNNEIDVKGIYKNPPEYIHKYVLPFLLLNNDIFSNKLQSLIDVYSRKFFNILYLSNLFDQIKYYYSFNNKYLSAELKLEAVPFGPNLKDTVEPFLILKEFIFPLLSLLRLEK
jgi:hypothetical protein